MPIYIDWVCDKVPGSEKDRSGPTDPRYGCVNDVRVFRITHDPAASERAGSERWVAVILPPYYSPEMTDADGAPMPYKDCAEWCFSKLASLQRRETEENP